MTEPERKQLLDLIGQVRSQMNTQLDALAAAVTNSTHAPKRRAPVRPALGGPVLIPDDIARAKARAALQRMGMVR